MKRTLSYSITNKNKADTIGAFLRDAGYSRRILIELKQNPEQICLNGTPSWLNTPLQSGDTLTLFLPDEPVSSDILPVNLPIDIVYEDEDLIILNKAAGLSTRPRDTMKIRWQTPSRTGLPRAANISCSVP